MELRVVLAYWFQRRRLKMLTDDGWTDGQTDGGSGELINGISIHEDFFE